MISSARRRWSDNDLHFGPLTFAYGGDYRPFAIILSSGSKARDNPGCCLRFSAFGLTVISELPQIVKPWKQWVPFGALGQGYWDEHPREYGFSLNDGFLHVMLGAQTMDSSTTQDWSWFLPWTQWRHISHVVFDPTGSAFQVADIDWFEHRKIVDAIKRHRFFIEDEDGECIEAATYVEERQWRFGTGHFKWLGFFRPKKIVRTLNITFSSEVGPEKGSWKGGVVGTSSPIAVGETQEAALRRYCDQEHRSKYRSYRIKFVAPVI